MHKEEWEFWKFRIEMLNGYAYFQKQRFRKQHSIWHPPNPFPKGIHRVKNSWVHPPKIENFYEQFMRSFLASSVEAIFHGNNLRGVHTVIDKESPFNGNNPA
jgi:hypothetical protein